MRAFAFLVATLVVTPAAAQDTVHFQSPTGNIHCLISGPPWAEARCDLLQATVNFRRPVDCDLEWGLSFGVGASGSGAPLCVGDTTAMPGAPVLGYGRSVSHAGFICLSEQSGVTCQNAQGHGFKVARSAQRVF